MYIPPANSIQEVLDRLDKIIEWARNKESPLGYFATLYRQVTAEVQKGIQEDAFEDGARMERLDVVFANRYLNALHLYLGKQTCPRTWKIAFDASHNTNLMVLQHLLLGIHAHINVDLGIAAGQVAPQDAIWHLKSDFDEINAILERMVDEVEAKLAKAWPLLQKVDSLMGKADEYFAVFSIRYARREAWRVAKTYAYLPAHRQPVYIQQLDKDMTKLANKLVDPGWPVRWVLRFLKMGELKSVPEIMDLLK